MRKTILISGGGGYVGNVTCRWFLWQGYKVRCLDNFHKGHCDALISLIDHEDFEFMYGDITDPEVCKKAVDGVDGIVHLAAIVGFPACKAQPALSEAVNVGGTRALLKARDARTPFVFASTGSVYGKVDGICTEDSPLNAQSLYGLHKKEAEDMVSSEPNTVSYRFATGFGVSPNMRVNLLVNDLVYQAVTSGALNVFQPDFRRTFVHVKDMARAFEFGLKCAHFKHRVYNCGHNDLNWTKRELAEYIKEKTGAFVSYNESGIDADQRDYEVDYSRLTTEGFTCKTTMEEGIDDLLKVIPLIRIRHQYM